MSINVQVSGQCIIWFLPVALLVSIIVLFASSKNNGVKNIAGLMFVVWLVCCVVIYAVSGSPLGTVARIGPTWCIVPIELVVLATLIATLYVIRGRE